MYENIAILIPCYCPTKSTPVLTEALTGLGIRHIIAVDDGSGRAYKEIFERLDAQGCHVVTHSANFGKGAAVKTGIRYVRETMPACRYIVTADCDGQHLPADILKIVEKACEEPPGEEHVILGERNFSDPNVPARSRFGNWFSSHYFHLVTGVRCPDTQTGLRGIPARFFDLALTTTGTRYEYEMNFLMETAGNLCYIPIQTVYENRNTASHFNTVRDSLRIYRTPLRYAVTSLSSAAVDLTLFSLFSLFFASYTGAIAIATVAARILSGIFNFILNRVWTFEDNQARSGSAVGQSIRYLALFISIMLASSALVTLLAFIPIPNVIIKAFVDTALAVLSFLAQKNWVFKNKRKDTNVENVGVRKWVRL